MSEQPTSPSLEIETTLREDREEGRRHDETCASEESIATCQRIARSIRSLLASPPDGFKWAAFGSSDGGAELTLHSSASKRQVTFRISADGHEVSAFSIDEDMRTGSVPVDLCDDRTIRERAAWVQGESGDE